MSLLIKNLKDYNVEGINCTATGKYYNGDKYGVEIDKRTSTMTGFKTRDFDNLYINGVYNPNKDFELVLVGEDENKYYFISANAATLYSTNKSKFAPTILEDFDISYTDFVVSFKDLDNDKYKVVIELGDNISSDIVQKNYIFDLELPRSGKILGLINREDNMSFPGMLEALQSSVKEEDLGMKIDTTLDKEPIYFCDGTKDRLILTEDMIVRGNINFDNDEITINDKRIITEDNLKG